MSFGAMFTDGTCTGDGWQVKRRDLLMDVPIVLNEMNACSG
jgi:hypothetical protein